MMNEYPELAEARASTGSAACVSTEQRATATEARLGTLDKSPVGLLRRVGALRHIEQLPDDGLDHEFCWSCGAETVDHVDTGETVKFYCRTRESFEERSLYVPANYVRWFDDEQRYWHESAGVFVSRD